MLSDVDIRNELGKGIVIDPFHEHSLTPIGYDLRVGEYGFSWKTRRQIKITEEKPLLVQPYDTVLISTYERVELSRDFGAVIHARVTLMSEGLSHISTTIDPGWKGRLLIQLHNQRPVAIPLRSQERFCTACFYKMQSTAEKEQGHPADREDIQRHLAKIQHEAASREARLFYRNPRFQLAIAAVITIAAGFLVWRLNSDWLAPTISIFGIASLFLIEALKPTR